MIKELILKSRSYRRFWEEKRVDASILEEIVDNIRLTSSARNIQPLKYATITDSQSCETVFSTLSWAGYIENGAPKEGERPSGYIIILNDKSIAPSSLWDQGIVCQTASLCAVEKGLGCCIIASVNREKFGNEFALPDNLEIALVLAVGYPKEEVVITEMKNNDYKYYRDENGVHYVPKRSFDEVCIKIVSKL